VTIGEAQAPAQLQNVAEAVGGDSPGLASAGSVCWDSRLMWIKSAIIRWSTSREALSRQSPD